MNTTLTLVNIFAVIVLCELIASPAAAVSLATERTHCIDAVLSKPATVAACDAFIDVFTGDAVRQQLIAHKARADDLLSGVPALLFARPAASAAVIQVWVLLFLLHLRNLSCSWEVPNVGRGKLCGLLALDAARPEDQPTLVAYQEAVFAALALGLGHSPQQAAVTAPLHKQGLEAGVVTVWHGTALLLIGQVDTCGTMQLLQLVMAALLLDHPAFLGF